MKQKFSRLLADLRFAIFILLLISFCSIIGTIIEQDQPIEIYKNNYPLTNPIFGFLSWDKILFFGFDHVYKTWWFLLLIFLFGCSLTLCSFLQQLPSLKIARRCQFFRTPNPFYKLKISTVLNKFYFSKIISRIKQKRYSIFQQRNMIYCYKGLIGRIGPIIVHFSIILILLGTVVGALFGFKAQEIVPKTESFHIQNTINTGPSAFIPKTSIRINDFWINYTKTKTISQFYSDVSILNQQGNEIKHKTISVNYPLVFKGIYYYQTDWNIIGLRFKIKDNLPIEYPVVNVFGNQEKVWLTWMSEKENLQQGIIIIVSNLEGYCSIYNNAGQFLGNLEINESGIFPQSIDFLELISLTGLQVKIDPGISLIYSGFFFLMLSSLVSYITYSQIWMICQNKQIFIGGNTNRAVFEFELEFFKFLQ